MNARFSAPCLRAALVSAVIILAFAACDDPATPDDPLSITITQPANGAVVQDSILRIIAEVKVKCGCNSHVEFHIDGEHMYSDYFPFYSFDWATLGLKGEHQIAARLVVKDVGEAWDTVTVRISGSDSLRHTGRPSR